MSFLVLQSPINLTQQIFNQHWDPTNYLTDENRALSHHLLSPVNPQASQVYPSVLNETIDSLPIITDPITTRPRSLPIKLPDSLLSLYQACH